MHELLEIKNAITVELGEFSSRYDQVRDTGAAGCAVGQQHPADGSGDCPAWTSSNPNFK